MIQHRHSFHWLWFLPTIVLIIAGLGVGFSSHQITQHVFIPHSPSPDPYENSQQGASYHLATGTQSGNLYINADGSSDYFAAFKGDFNPPIAQSDIDNSASINFVARTDTVTLNPPLNTDTGTVYEAHKIVQLVFYDSNGKAMATYTTTEYASYLATGNQSMSTTTNSFLNEWPLGFALIIAGLFWSGCTTLVLVIRKQAKKRRVTMAGVYPSPYDGAFSQTYANQQPYYPQSPYDHLSRPYIAPPPPPLLPHSSPSVTSEQFNLPAKQIEPTQFAPPPPN